MSVGTNVEQGMRFRMKSTKIFINNYKKIFINKYL